MHLAKKYGVGVVAVMSEEAIPQICAACDGLIIPGSATDIPPAYYNGAPLEKDPPVDEYALDSALTGRPLRRDVAMTGEVTLRGKVLAIGGLKEKTMAALRCGIGTVIITAVNAALIDLFGKLLDKCFTFEPRFPRLMRLLGRNNGVNT